MIELSSDDELSDLDLEIEKDKVKEPMGTPIKKEPVDPDYEKEDTKTKPVDETTKMKTGDESQEPNPTHNGDEDVFLPENGGEPLSNSPRIKTEKTSPVHPNSSDITGGSRITSNQTGKGNPPNEVVVKPVWMDPQSEQVESKLTELGALIVDDDVLYALKNLKQMGQTMKQAVQNDAEAFNQSSLLCGSSLFRDVRSNVSGTVNPVDIMTPLDGTPAFIKQESQSGISYASPPPAGRVFSGLKCLSSEEFVKNTSSAKRKRTGSTPAQSPSIGSPSHAKSSMEILQSQTEAKGKLALAAEMFIRKKKLTNSNCMTIYDSVVKRKHDVIQFDDGPQSFYRIMTHYALDLNFTPDDVKHKDLQQQLFTLIMANVSYTKVCNCKCVQLLTIPDM